MLDLPDDIPDGWVMKPLRAVLAQQERKITVVPTEKYVRLGVRWYSDGPFMKDAVLGREVKGRHLFRVQANDFIYNRLFAWKGSFGVVPMEMDGCFVSNEFPVFATDSTEADPEFIWRWCSLPAVWKAAEDKSSGSTRTSRLRFKEEDLFNLSIPLPPLREQRAIVYVLRTLQQAKEATERVVAAARQLKQSLLRHLFTYGPTTFDQADRVVLKETEVGAMPERWALQSCDSVCDQISVGIVVKPASHYVDSGVPAFRSFNVREDRLVPNDLVFISREANDSKLAKSKLKAGDVLIVRTGFPGTSCVVPPDFAGANCIDIVFARPKAADILSEFLSRYLNSEGGKRQALASKAGLAQQHLNVAAVKRTLVPLPPLRIQRHIVDYLAGIDRKIESEEKRCESLDDLFQSSLHNLMTGKVRVGAGGGP